MIYLRRCFTAKDAAFNELKIIAYARVLILKLIFQALSVRITLLETVETLIL